jgi:hypothetical protein
MPLARLFRRSKLGLVLAGLFLVIAVALYFHSSFACRGDFLCRGVALFAYVPASFLYAPVMQLRWGAFEDLVRFLVIAASTLTNAVLYYCVGWVIEVFVRLIGRAVSALRA